MCSPSISNITQSFFGWGSDTVLVPPGEHATPPHPPNSLFGINGMCVFVLMLFSADMKGGSVETNTIIGGRSIKTSPHLIIGERETSQWPEKYRLKSFPKV